MGYTVFTCHCGHTYTDHYTDATGHDWAEATTEAPKTCNKCGETEGEKLPAPIPEPTPEPAPEKDHSKCEPDSVITKIINMIINFLRGLLGLPEECYCGEELK